MRRMKQSLLVSVALHLFVIGIISLVTFLPTPQKKPEPIKITVVNPAPKTPEPIQTPQPTPKTEPTFEQPKEVQPQKPIVTPPIKPVVAAPVEALIPTAPIVPVSKPVEPAVTKVAPPVENKPVEKKTVEPLNPDPSIKEGYLSYLRQTIDERKVYPKNAKRLRQSGTVTVRFTLLPNGTITNVSVVGSSGFELLDDATIELLRSIAQVRALPKEIASAPMELTLPIQYSLK